MALSPRHDGHRNGSDVGNGMARLHSTQRQVFDTSLTFVTSIKRPTVSAVLASGELDANLSECDGLTALEFERAVVDKADSLLTTLCGRV